MTVCRTTQDVEQYDLGSLRLYREDLRAIATAVSEAGELTVTCDDFEATSPDDFGQLPEKLTTVTMRVQRGPGGIEVLLSDQEAAVRRRT